MRLGAMAGKFTVVEGAVHGAASAGGRRSSEVAHGLEVIAQDWNADLAQGAQHVPPGTQVLVAFSLTQGDGIPGSHEDTEELESASACLVDGLLEEGARITALTEVQIARGLVHAADVQTEAVHADRGEEVEVIVGEAVPVERVLYGHGFLPTDLLRVRRQSSYIPNAKIRERSSAATPGAKGPER